MAQYNDLGSTVGGRLDELGHQALCQPLHGINGCYKRQNLQSAKIMRRVNIPQEIF